VADHEITIKIKSGATTSADPSPEELEEDWVDYHHDWPKDPNTGENWTWDAIDALQAGFDLECGEEGRSECTQLYVEVTYTPAGIARPLVGGSLAGNSLVGKGLAR
jgi:hypothetical protein